MELWPRRSLRIQRVCQIFCVVRERRLSHLLALYLMIEFTVEYSLIYELPVLITRLDGIAQLARTRASGYRRLIDDFSFYIFLDLMFQLAFTVQAIFN